MTQAATSRQSVRKRDGENGTEVPSSNRPREAPSPGEVPAGTTCVSGGPEGRHRLGSSFTGSTRCGGADSGTVGFAVHQVGSRRWGRRTVQPAVSDTTPRGPNHALSDVTVTRTGIS
jgi:hypothetical protein